MPTNNTENIYSTEFENDPNPIPSTKVGYDNSESGLEATTVQGAIDELDSKIKASDEASEITFDNIESGLEAENVQAGIDEIVSMLGDYQFLGKEYIPITIAGDVPNFCAKYCDELKAFLDTLEDDIYYMPYLLFAVSKNGTETVTSYGGNAVKQEQLYKLIHKGMNASDLQIEADAAVLFANSTKWRFRKILASPTTGGVTYLEFDSTTTPPSFAIVSHNTDVCDSVQSTLFCLKFKKVK